MSGAEPLTIQRSQGLEADYAIVSYARNSKTSPQDGTITTLGFIEQRHELVATSRRRFGTILVGNFRWIRTAKRNTALPNDNIAITRLIDYAEALGTYADVSLPPALCCDGEARSA